MNPDSYTTVTPVDAQRGIHRHQHYRQINGSSAGDGEGFEPPPHLLTSWDNLKNVRVAVIKEMLKYHLSSTNGCWNLDCKLKIAMLISECRQVLFTHKRLYFSEIQAATHHYYYRMNRKITLKNQHVRKNEHLPSPRPQWYALRVKLCHLLKWRKADNWLSQGDTSRWLSDVALIKFSRN